MKKEIEESFHTTEKERNDFKFYNRGKVVKGSYERINSGKGNWKKFQTYAGVFINAKGIWKDVKNKILKGIEKSYNPLVVGVTAKVITQNNSK